MTWKKFLKTKFKLLIIIFILLFSVFFIIKSCRKKETVSDILKKIEKSKKIGELLRNEYERLKSTLHKTN
jgi:hypothetical protein